MNRVIWSTIGFVMFVLGFLSTILGIIGIGLFPVTLIDSMFSNSVAMMVKVAMIFVGMAIFYVNRTGGRHDD